MTVEHLGTDATERDLAAFRAAVARIMDERGIGEPEATEIIWNNGDFYTMLTAEEAEGARAACPTCAGAADIDSWTPERIDAAFDIYNTSAATRLVCRTCGSETIRA
jgi:hypothetical protein